MANQTIPITLSWGPVTVDISALNINQLGELISAQLAGAIRADVSFYLEVLFDPTNFVTNLIYNSTQGVWKAWNAGTGTYVALTQYQIGDVKNSFSGNDQLSVGWVVLDGRAFTAIPGLSATQLATLQTLFGGTTLPVVAPTNTANLPGANAFSGIDKPPVLPADGVIAALPIDAVYSETEVEALRDATETLRDSTEAVEDQVTQIQDRCTDLLAALRQSTSPTLYTMVFIGFA